MILWGKKRTALFQTDNWESFFQGARTCICRDITLIGLINVLGAPHFKFKEKQHLEPIEAQTHTKNQNK